MPAPRCRTADKRSLLKQVKLRDNFSFKVFRVLVLKAFIVDGTGRLGRIMVIIQISSGTENRMKKLLISVLALVLPVLSQAGDYSSQLVVQTGLLRESSRQVLCGRSSEGNHDGRHAQLQLEHPQGQSRVAHHPRLCGRHRRSYGHGGNPGGGCEHHQGWWWQQRWWWERPQEVTVVDYTRVPVLGRHPFLCANRD